ncbi:MAG: hypothetical protein K9M15_01140 [Candidatus Marinimicrobia bacterium]|nr:hypothetical protein [Candidatus Neomarinimicrobiota bacterium]
MNIKKNKHNQGSILILVIVFGSVFSVLFGGTFGYIFTQHKFQAGKIEREKALDIAEAGVNYYRWRLAHYPDDLQDGTGESGPYEHEYSDPEGEAVGKFSLDIVGVDQCGFPSAIDITSTGWTYDEPSFTREIKVRYSRPSVAEYAYIINSSVWAGSDRVISGKYHSNGGIRMDGVSDSLVSSAEEVWNCTSSFGCDDPYEEKPGVFGDGGGDLLGLWQYPVEPVDFNAISLDLSQMKTVAQSDGLYFAKPTSGKGYHVIFKQDGTFDLYRVISVNSTRGYDSEEGWHWDYHDIKKESFLQNYNIPSGCSLIFVEANLWVEGVVNGKVSIASANLVNPNTDTDVILNGNITYADSDGSDGLLVLGQNNVLIPLYSPDEMELNGIYIAQKGHFGRNHYSCSSYWPWCDRQSLEMSGSIISNGRVGTQWTSGGVFSSGYRNRENSYDRKLMTSPPPLTPFSDDEFGFIKWEELN